MEGISGFMNVVGLKGNGSMIWQDRTRRVHPANENL